MKIVNRTLRKMILKLKKVKRSGCTVVLDRLEADIFISLLPNKYFAVDEEKKNGKVKVTVLKVVKL